MLSELLGELNGSIPEPGLCRRQRNAYRYSGSLFTDESYDGAGLKIKEIMKQSPFTQKKTEVKAGCIIEKVGRYSD